MISVDHAGLTLSTTQKWYTSPQRYYEDEREGWEGGEGGKEEVWERRHLRDGEQTTRCDSTAHMMSRKGLPIKQMGLVDRRVVCRYTWSQRQTSPPTPAKGW